MHTPKRTTLKRFNVQVRLLLASPEGESTITSDFRENANQMRYYDDSDAKQEELAPRLVTKTMVWDGTEFDFYNINSQLQPRKWSNLFQHTLDAVIFSLPLSWYNDYQLQGGQRINRMQAALETFSSLCKAFNGRTDIILLLTETEVFAERIWNCDIASQAAFSDYRGPPADFESGAMYFIKKCKALCPQVENGWNDMFIRVTDSSDTTLFKFVLDCTSNIIMKENLRSSGFLSGPCVSKRSSLRHLLLSRSKQLQA
jgi:hypothetical protein